MASLTVLKGTNPGQRFNLDGDQFVLGRKPECEIHIANNSVSREHAQISRSQGAFFIEDLKSRNGTWVNNADIKQQKVQLKDNDRIKICDCLFTFNQETPPSSEIQIDDDAPETPSTVHASMSQMSPHDLLEAQPTEKLRALLEVAATLSKTLNEETLLPQIAEILFNLFKQADRCFVIMREDSDGVEKLMPKVIRTRRANTETTTRFSRTIVRRCLDSGQALLFEDAQNGGQMSLSASIAEFRIRSVMCAPLMTPEGIASGLIQLDSQDRNNAFTSDDLKLLVGVASQAAIALDNTILHRLAIEMAVKQKDEQLAKDVQRSFLPASLPEIEGYEFYAFYQAAKNVGGDYYDFIRHSGGKLGVLLGDVAGKGMPAALLMAKLSSEARYCLLMHAELSTAVGRLNEQLLQAGMMDRFVTLSASLLDPTSHAVAFASAGHESPLIYRRATHTLEQGIERKLSGFPLGMMDGTAYECNSVELSPGDAVIIFTDGVTEALNLQNVQFGMERVHKAILGEGAPANEEYSAPAIGRRLNAAVQRHFAGQYQNDDIALVCFGRPEEPFAVKPATSGRISTASGPMTQTVKRTGAKE